MRISGLYTFLVLLLLISCSNDDDVNEQALKNVVAIVKGQATCQTMDNGFVYEVELENTIITESNTSLKIIGITNLPEEMRTEGLKINMDIERAEFPDGACTANYSPEFFYQTIRTNIEP